MSLSPSPIEEWIITAIKEKALTDEACQLLLGEEEPECCCESHYECRIFPEVTPPKSGLPAMIYQNIGGNFEQCLDKGAARCGEYVYAVRLFSKCRADIISLRECLRCLFDGQCFKLKDCYLVDNIVFSEPGTDYDTEDCVYESNFTLTFCIRDDENCGCKSCDS